MHPHDSIEPQPATEDKRERIAEQQRKWREKNHEYRLEYERKYREANKEQRAEYTRKYREEHRESYLESNRKHTRKWNKEHPLARRASRLRARARKRNAEGTYSASDIREQYEKQSGKCFWCGEHVGDTYHVDHVVPLARGGSNTPDNLVISCPRCNQSKRDMLVSEWFRQPSLF